jgi:hypothetical protein
MEAQRRPDNPAMSCLTGCLIFSSVMIGLPILFGFVGCLSVVMSSKNTASENYEKPSKSQTIPKTKTASSSNTGNLRILNNGADAPFVPVFTDRESLNDFTRSVAQGDKEGFVQLYLRGKVLEVKQNTKVRIIDYGGFMSGVYRIRILGGENYGQDGWIHQEWVK